MHCVKIVLIDLNLMTVAQPFLMGSYVMGHAHNAHVCTESDFHIPSHHDNCNTYYNYYYIIGSLDCYTISLLVCYGYYATSTSDTSEISENTALHHINVT